MTSPPAAIIHSARFSIRAGVLASVFALLAPVITHAAAVTNPVSVTVSFAGRPGFPQDLFAVVMVRSVLGGPVIGQVTIDTNGLPRKTETVVTASQALVNVNLGRVTGPIMACATFGGMADVGDGNWQSTQASACSSFAPPPPRVEPPRTSPTPLTPPGLRSGLRLR